MKRGIGFKFLCAAMLLCSGSAMAQYYDYSTQYHNHYYSVGDYGYGQHYRPLGPHWYQQPQYNPTMRTQYYYQAPSYYRAPSYYQAPTYYYPNQTQRVYNVRPGRGGRW